MTKFHLIAVMAVCVGCVSQEAIQEAPKTAELDYEIKVFNLQEAIRLERVVSSGLAQATLDDETLNEMSENAKKAYEKDILKRRNSIESATERLRKAEAAFSAEELALAKAEIEGEEELRRIRQEKDIRERHASNMSSSVKDKPAEQNLEIRAAQIAKIRELTGIELGGDLPEDITIPQGSENRQWVREYNAKKTYRYFNKYRLTVMAGKVGAIEMVAEIDKKYSPASVLQELERSVVDILKAICDDSEEAENIYQQYQARNSTGTSRSVSLLSKGRRIFTYRIGELSINASLSDPEDNMRGKVNDGCYSCMIRLEEHGISNALKEAMEEARKNSGETLPSYDVSSPADVGPKKMVENDEPKQMEESKVEAPKRTGLLNRGNNSSPLQSFAQRKAERDARRLEEEKRQEEQRAKKEVEREEMKAALAEMKMQLAEQRRLRELEAQAAQEEAKRAALESVVESENEE